MRHACKPAHRACWRAERRATLACGRCTPGRPRYMLACGRCTLAEPMCRLACGRCMRPERRGCPHVGDACVQTDVLACSRFESLFQRRHAGGNVLERLLLQCIHLLPCSYPESVPERCLPC